MTTDREQLDKMRLRADYLLRQAKSARREGDSQWAAELEAVAQDTYEAADDLQARLEQS